MAGVFPSAHTLEAFWSIIAGARATAREVPRERWSVWPAVHAGEPPTPDSVASRSACLIDGFTPELDGLCLDAETLDGLETKGRVVFRYVTNPNGAERNIAGIRNEKGNVVGLMPHPDRCYEPDLGTGDGRRVFESLVAWTKAHA